MNKLLITFLLIFLVINISAQVNNGENSSTEEIIYQMRDDAYEGEEEEEEEEEGGDSFALTFLRKGNNYNLYNTYSLNENFNWIVSKEKNTVGVIKEGKPFLPAVFSANRNQKGDKIILGYDKGNGLYDLEADRWIFPPIIYWIEKFNSDLFAMRFRDGKFFLINSKSEILEKTNWERCDKSKINTNHFIIKIGKKSGLYDAKSSKFILEPIYEKLITRKGKYIVSKNRLEYKILNANAKEIMVKSAEIAEKEFNIKNYSDKFWVRNTEGKWDIINPEGKQISYGFDKYKYLASGGSGVIYYQVMKDSKLAVFVKEEASGSFTQFFDYKYKSYKFYKDYIIVGTNTGYRLLDYSKKDVFGKEYESIRRFFSENFFVKKNGNWFYIDLKGEKIINESFEDFSYYPKGAMTNISKTTYGKYKASNQKYGVINADGVLITEPIFDDIVYGAWKLIMVRNGEKLRWYNLIKNKYENDIEFDHFYDSGSKIYCWTKDKYYYTGTGRFFDDFFFRELNFPKSRNY